MSAYKILTQKEPSFYLTHAKEHFSVQKSTEKPQTCPGLDIYDVLYNMVTHLDPGKFLQFAITALIMLEWLKSTGYFRLVPIVKISSQFLLGSLQCCFLSINLKIANFGNITKKLYK